MNNEKIRNALKENGLKQWELADLLGMPETSLCKKMRKELPEDLQADMLKLIEDNSRIKE